MTSVTQTQWPAVTSLSQAITAEVALLNSLEPHINCLSGNVTALQGSLPVGTLLNQQISDIQSIFAVITDIFNFLDDIDVLDNVFVEAAATINQQSKDCSSIISGLSDLNQAINSIGSAVKTAEADLPSATVIKSAIATLNGWDSSANNLLSVFNNLNNSLSTDKQKTDLANIEKTFNTACATLSTTLGELSTNTQTILTTVASINTALCDYAKSLSPISKNSVLIAQKSMPAVNSAAKKMKEINAILNPISIVLSVSGCTDASNKSFYNSKLTDTKNGVKSLASDNANEVAGIINDFVDTSSEGYLSVEPLYKDVNSATEALSQSVVGHLKTQLGNLTSNLTTFNNSLQAKCHYTSNNTNFENQFLDSETIQSLNSLMASTATN